MHIKRKTIPKFWPITRTGTKYIAVASHEKDNAIPLVIVLRDIIGMIKNKKEIKQLIKEKKILVNTRAISDFHYPLLLFDTLSIPSAKKNYRVGLSNKKFSFEEISEKESHHRIYKVVDKRKIKGKKVQINLNNGRNFISSEKIATGEFVLLDMTQNKILKVISLKKDTPVIIIGGKHAGKSGKIKEILKEGENTLVAVTTKEGEVKVNIKDIFAKE